MQMTQVKGSFHTAHTDKRLKLPYAVVPGSRLFQFTIHKRSYHST